MKINFFFLLQLRYASLPSLITSHDASAMTDDVCTAANVGLANELNDMRETRGLQRIPISRSLTMTAHAHAVSPLDKSSGAAAGKTCNLHSWGKDPSGSTRWSECCYTSDHANPSCMWSKPMQVTSKYTGDGYDN